MEFFTGIFGRVVNKSEAGAGVACQQVIAFQRLASIAAFSQSVNWSPFGVTSWRAGE
jgi:hypothetical protein